MDTKSNGHLIQERLSSLDMKAGDGLFLDTLMSLAVKAGASSDEAEQSVINANANGWIIIADEMVHLTASGLSC